jgi:hypothetical protein
MGSLKSFFVVCLTIAVSVAFAASPRNDQAAYVGGTLSIARGAMGILDVSAPKALLFTYGETSYSIPYDVITGMEWSDKLGRREKSMSAQTRTIMAAPIHLWKKKLQYLTFSFREGEGNQVAIFELAEDTIRPLVPALEARTGKKVEFEDSLAPAAPQTAGLSATTPSAPLPVVPPPAPSPMVDVSFVSKPTGAMVLFYGMPAGKTPMTTKLMPGDYKVTMRATGMKDWIQDFSVEPAKPVSLLAELKPQPVVIEASTNHVVLPGPPTASPSDAAPATPAKKNVRRKKTTTAAAEPPAENPKILVGHVK